MTFKQTNKQTEIAGVKRREGIGLWWKSFTFIPVILLTIRKGSLFHIISLVSCDKMVHGSSFCYVNFEVELEVDLIPS